MKLKPALIVWLIRVTATPTLVALIVALAYVLFQPTPFVARDFWTMLGPFFFISVHSVVLVGLLSRVQTSGFAYRYSRGFSRDTLWLNQMIASTLSVLIVWAPAAFCVWFGLRSLVQEHVMRNPEYPVMAPTDTPLLWFCLVGYVIALPTLHYAWIRRNQPTRGQGSGDSLIAAIVLAAFVVLAMSHYRELWVQVLAILGGTTIGLTLLVAAWRLHRHVEVQK